MCCHLLTVSIIRFCKRKFSGTLAECQAVWTQIKSDILYVDPEMGPNCMQLFSADDKVSATKGRVNSLITNVVCRSLLQTVWFTLRPDNLSGLIRIRTVWHADGILESIFHWNRFWKKKISRWQKHETFPRGQRVHKIIYLKLWLTHQQMNQILSP